MIFIFIISEFTAGQKSRGKKTRDIKYIKFFIREIAFLGSFSQFKNWFLAIFEIAKKMEFGQKKILLEIDLFDFTSFF